ncbi:MAG: peptidylprolyl isomerase [Acidobacteriota bacterium]
MNKMKTVSMIIVALIFGMVGAFFLVSEITRAKSEPPEEASVTKPFAPRSPDNPDTEKSAFSFPASKRETAAPIAAPSKMLSEGEAQAVIATVNGVSITAGELEEELDKVLISPTAHSSMNGKKRDDLRNTALDELIVRELAYQKAKALGLRVAKKDLAEAIQKIKTRYKTEKNFQEALQADHISESEFTQRIEKDLLLRKIHQVAIEDKAKVADLEVKKYYEANKNKFTVPPSLHLNDIVIKHRPNNEAAAKQKIDEAYESIKSGKTFSEVAYKYSEDDYRVMGGDYGQIHRGQLNAELETIVFAAPVGELLTPVFIAQEWHLIKVENRQSERLLKFDEVKDKIRNALVEKRRKDTLVQFINDLKAAAKIEYVNEQ